MISRENLFTILVSFSFYMALFRATEMGYGYPTSEHQLGLISFLPQKLMQMALLAIILVLMLFSFWKKFIHLKFSAPVKLLALSVVFSIVFSEYVALSLRFLLSMLVVMLPVYFYYIQFGRNKLFRSFFLFLRMILYFNILYIVLFPQYAFMTGIHDGALRGAFIHKNAFGSTMAIVFIFYYVSWLKLSRRFISTSFALLLIAALFIFASKSMTAILIAVIGVATNTVFTQILSLKSKKHKHLMFTAFVVVMTASVSIFNIYLNDFLIFIGKDPTLTGRTGLWEVLIRVGLERPLFGHGLGLFSRPEVMYQFSQEFGWEAKSTHSSVLDVFLGVGLIGLTSLSIIIVRTVWGTIFINAAQAQHRTALIVSISTLAVSIVSAFVSSGVLLSNTFDWLVIVLLIIFLNSFSHKSIPTRT